MTWQQKLCPKKRDKIANVSPQFLDYFKIKWRILLLCCYVHRVAKKASHLVFDNKFGKCGSIFKILSPGDS